MPLPYPSWNVVYGEIPAASKWSQLGANDDALAAGTAFTDRAIKSEAIDFDTFASDPEWDSGWINVTFAGGWGSNGGAIVGYRMIGGTVSFRGQATRAGGLDASTIFTLPPAFWPAVQRIFTGPGSSLNYGKVVVNTNGTVNLGALPAGGSYIGLDPVAYAVG